MRVHTFDLKRNYGIHMKAKWILLFSFYRFKKYKIIYLSSQSSKISIFSRYWKTLRAMDLEDMQKWAGLVLLLLRPPSILVKVWLRPCLGSVCAGSGSAPDVVPVTYVEIHFLEGSSLDKSFHSGTSRPDLTEDWNV